MKSLVLHCAFVGHTYQGVRLTPEQKEELDWPPAPGRLHQALMAAALTGIPPGREEQLAQDALDALRWVEQQPSPTILASAISEDRNAATRFRLAIPQNNPAKTDLTKTSMLLAPTLSHRAVAKSSALRIDYVWKLQNAAEEEAAERHRVVLADLAAQVRYLGRAEDQIEARLGLREIDAGGCETWCPTDGAADVDLLAARPGTTRDLIRNHTKPVPGRTRKSPASRFLRAQGYARGVVEGLRPVHVAIFQLLAERGDPDEVPLSCDAENAGIWRSRVRQRAVDFALDSGRWDDPDLARELISGHPPGQSTRTEQPHLAFVPLPSINSQGKADGRVRRIALVGYARPEIKSEAVDVYQVLCASLDGEDIGAGASYYHLRLFDYGPETDKVWSQLVRCSRVWHSVTPVALAGGFKVPKHSADGRRELTSNERRLRQLAEWTALLRSSLKHIGLPGELVDACAIMLTPSPLLPNTSRAERYRTPGEWAVLTHARIEFSEPIRGPLIVGDRRYQGYGLFLPH
ncbi:MAG TPA: type I-U CRISPR-associated protein Csb2 [Bryobacteraceae bacterium]|nr:type I-U CRISPR-associated protein Csb2 [Bryobacteraceae bacterium]